MIDYAEPQFNAVPLNKAIVCLDCNYVTESKHGVCARCGSRGTFPLIKWLDQDQNLPVIVTGIEKELGYNPHDVSNRLGVVDGLF